MSGRWRRSSLVAVGLLAALSTHGQAPNNPRSVGVDHGEQWWVQDSEHVRLHYRQQGDADATAVWVNHVAARADAAFQRLSPSLNWRPHGRIHLVLDDNSDSANGWATTLPFNQSRLLLSPPDQFNTLENQSDWLDTLITHELTHVLHLDKAHGSPRFLRRVFGRLDWLFPNLFQPQFMVEGLAIHYESDALTGEGRAFSALYAGEMQAQVNAGARSLSQVSVTNRRWPGADGYLYGAFFFRYLQDTYGDEGIQRLIEEYSDNLLPFSLNRSARRALGTDMQGLWSGYQNWLQQTFGSTPDDHAGEPLTQHGLRHYPPIAHRDGIYRIVDDGHGPQRLVRYPYDPSQNSITITTVRHPGLFDINSDGDVVMAKRRQRASNSQFDDLYLFSAGRWQRLTYHGRYREARWSGSQTLIARRIVNGISQLDRLDRDGNRLGTLWQGQPGEVLGPFTLHPQGSYLVAAFKPQQRSWQLARIDLADGDLTLLTDNAHLQGEPRFSAAGDLLFSADYDGRMNSYLWRPDLAPLQLTRRRTAAMTPTLGDDGLLYSQQLSHRGFDLWRQAVTPLGSASVTPVAEAVEHDNPPTDTAATLTDPVPYSPWSSLRPRSVLPLVVVTEDSVLAGASTFGSDSLGLHQYSATLAYESRSQSPAGLFSYQYANRYQGFYERSLSFTREQERITRVRAADTLSLSRLNLWTGWDDFLELRVGVTGERDSDIFVAPGAEGIGDRDRRLLGAALLFDNRQSFRFSISPAHGRRIVLVAETHRALDDDFDGEVFSLDWREFRHLGRSHVLALRGAASWGTDRPTLIRLGDHHGESQRVFGRDRYLLRGYADNTLFGRRVAVVGAEWRFPLARIQRNWNTYPLGLRDLHGALYTDNGWVSNAVTGPFDNRAYSSVGAELTTEAVLGYQLLLPVRVGIARGLDDALGETRAYLTLGARF